MNFALEVELPVRLRLEHPMTDDDLLRFCAENDMLRVERDSNGELIVMSPAGGGASMKNTSIIYQLAKWAEETGSGVAFDSNGGFTLPDGSMRSPDAAWIPWARWNALSAEQQEKFLPLCPEFVIELRSPSDRLGPLQEKMRAWIANGSQLAWLIDPERKAVEVYRPGREAEIFEGTSAVYGEGPVGGFALELTKNLGLTMRGLRIDYTIYSPNYAPGEGECWDYPTFRGAKTKAKELGVGSLVIRNFNSEKPLDWWQSPFCWLWDSRDFRKTRSLQDKKWVVAQSNRSQTALLKQFQSRQR